MPLDVSRRDINRSRLKPISKEKIAEVLFKELEKLGISENDISAVDIYLYGAYSRQPIIITLKDGTVLKASARKGSIKIDIVRLFGIKLDDESTEILKSSIKRAGDVKIYNNALMVISKDRSSVYYLEKAGGKYLAVFEKNGKKEFVETYDNLSEAVKSLFSLS